MNDPSDRLLSFKTSLKSYIFIIEKKHLIALETKSYEY